MGFHKTHSIEIRFVTGPENRLFSGRVRALFSRDIYGLVKKKKKGGGGREGRGVKAPETTTIGNKLNIEIKTTKSPGPE